MRELSRVLVVVSCLAACRPRAGDACQGSEARCLDDRTALVCQDGKALATPCKGPAGCKLESGAMVCDSSGNAEGDPCPRDAEGEGRCTVDGKAVARCKSGAYAIITCGGPSGCTTDAGKALCDRSIAAEGDACGPELAAATPCDAGGNAVLGCRDGKLVRATPCLGPMGCALADGGIVCDERVGVAGAAGCREGARACSEDGKSLLTCKAGKLEPDASCEVGCVVHDDPQRPPARVVDPATVVCDHGH
jgi:hypothetical protein